MEQNLLLGRSLASATSLLQEKGFVVQSNPTGPLGPNGQPARVVRVDRMDKQFQLTIVYPPVLPLTI